VSPSTAAITWSKHRFALLIDDTVERFWRKEATAGNRADLRDRASALLLWSARYKTVDGLADQGAYRRASSLRFRLEPPALVSAYEHLEPFSERAHTYSTVQDGWPVRPDSGEPRTA
jgi:hypothetical protein